MNKKEKHEGQRVFIALNGHDHHSWPTQKKTIGLVYAKTDKKSEAKTMFTEAAKIRRNMLGPDHPLTKKSEWLAAN